jgi:hypothetical protein
MGSVVIVLMKPSPLKVGTLQFARDVKGNFTSIGNRERCPHAANALVADSTWNTSWNTSNNLNKPLGVLFKN